MIPGVDAMMLYISASCVRQVMARQHAVWAINLFSGASMVKR